MALTVIWPRHFASGVPRRRAPRAPAGLPSAHSHLGLYGGDRLAVPPALANAQEGTKFFDDPQVNIGKFFVAA